MPKTAKAAAVAAVVGTAFAVWSLGGWSHGTALRAIDDLSSVLLSAVAAASALFTARTADGRQRAAWIALGVGLVGWALGDLLWMYYELRLHTEPFPSPADAAYLVFPVGFCLALLLFPHGHSGQSRVRLFLDGMIVTGSLFVVAWVVVLEKVYVAGAENRLTLALALAYPISDLVVLTVAVLVLTRARTTERLTLSLLGVGAICVAVSDGAFAYLSAQDAYTSGSWWTSAGSSACWSSRSPPWPGGTWRRTNRWPPRCRRGARSGCPTCWSCRPRWLSRCDLPEHAVRPAGVGDLVVIVAVMVRQFMVIAENRRLLATVAEQALRDPLTGVANYALFHDRLRQAMLLREREDFRSRCWRWTSTTSRWSTTAWATRPATRC